MSKALILSFPEISPDFWMHLPDECYNQAAVSDDPYLTEEPKFTIITEGKVSGELVNTLTGIKGVKSVTVF